MADVVRLVRVRRLAALGVTLEDVADALDGSSVRDLAGLLTDLDADLTAEEAAIRRKRGRLPELIECGVCDVDELGSRELAARNDRDSALAELGRQIVLFRRSACRSSDRSACCSNRTDDPDDSVWSVTYG